jgi:hypothetical protein
MYKLTMFEFNVTISDMWSIEEIKEELEKNLHAEEKGDSCLRYKLLLTQVYIDFQMKKMKNKYCNELE